MDATMSAERFQKFRRPTLADARGKILEIGFGSGINLPEYPKTVDAITALDPSPELYKLAHQRIQDSKMNVRFVLGTAEHMPFDSDSFDTVVSTWTLCSIPDVDRALEEIFRVLKPDGIFLFIEHGLSRSNFFQHVQHFLTPLFKRVSGGCHLDRDIRSLIQRSGFECVCQDFPSTGFAHELVHMYQGKGVKP